MRQQFEVKALVHGTEISNGHDENSVLIVNDEPDQLTLMGSLLHKAGYSVLTAEDGIEGLTLARRERPDLVISDVSMPRMNGLEFCREIRADSELKTVPILLVSARQKDTESAVAGLQAGADDYLEIPFDSARLVAKVSRLLERSRLEASYRDLVEQASDMIFTQDLSGKLTSMNLAGQRFLGRKPEEIIGNSFFAVFGIIPENNGFAAGLGQPHDGGEIRHQFVARSATGEDRWLDLIISPIKDKLDEPIGFRGLARDITERKHFEEALRDSEERYRLLFESTPQPIWVYREDTLAFLAVNEAATRTYGYSRDEFFSMTIYDIRPEEDIPTLMIKNAADPNDLVISSPWRHKTRSGQTIYVEMSSHPVVFDGKNSRLVIVNDVTERKLLDEKQQRLHTSLQQSAMEWRQTFNAIEFPVLIVDLDGTIKRSNLAAEQIVGVGPEEILGKRVGQLGENQPWKKSAALIEEIGLTQMPVAEEVKDEATGKTWAITLYHINEFGSVGERAILIAQDITKRAELEASLRQSEMMSLLGSLVAGVAHEVRNPLFGISSILDAFETRFSDRTEYLRYTNVLRDEIGRLTILMEELLEYGKPFRGELYLVSMEEMISRSVRACMPAAEVAQVNLETRVEESLPKIRIDRRRLSKVFVNLIENAIQHSPQKTAVVIEANRVTDSNQEWVQCAIKDSGGGISPDDMPKIFEPFFSKRRGGTGLGLAIAQRIMQEHQGKLIAGNNPEGGACMIARFPIPAEGDA
ncbi:MAG TPA: PAS domain S-box protein [Pyrinomonadaceae bacterium]|jgi:PAS domain S-box-containing protein|nr:PAS domain S-box protein [Pyrinomonadaceae bacterium]